MQKEPLELKKLLSPDQAPEISEILTPEELAEVEQILTHEEVKTVLAIALRTALVSRRAEIKTEEYRKKIMEEKQKPNINTRQLYAWILTRGREAIKGFKLGDKEKDLYITLCQYFTGDKAFEENGYSLDKGLWLYGGVGCGKTELMKLFRENPVENFGVVESIKIADMYKDKEIGVQVIENYSRAKSICFDDIGTEIESGESSNFGNRKNVIGEIILRHYAINDEKKFRYHFTTNLNAEQVGQLYGPRVRSRIREMCNIISLQGIEDKRK